MVNLLSNAIEQQRLVQILYDGSTRAVGPYFLGRNRNDELVFLGHQVSPWQPEDERWQIFELSKIDSLQLLDSRLWPLSEAVVLPVGKLSGIRLLV